MLFPVFVVLGAGIVTFMYSKQIGAAVSKLLK